VSGAVATLRPVADRVRPGSDPQERAERFQREQRAKASLADGYLEQAIGRCATRRAPTRCGAESSLRAMARTRSWADPAAPHRRQRAPELPADPCAGPPRARLRATACCPALHGLLQGGVVVPHQCRRLVELGQREPGHVLGERVAELVSSAGLGTVAPHESRCASTRRGTRGGRCLNHHQGAEADGRRVASATACAGRPRCMKRVAAICTSDAERPSPRRTCGRAREREARDVIAGSTCALRNDAGAVWPASHLGSALGGANYSDPRACPST
jgi:hypothetical protein